jgi:hypothetical protein
VRPSPNYLDRRGVVWGAVGVAVVVALTFIGSDRLVWFDAALVGYLFGVLFAVSECCTATPSGCADHRLQC